jgi:ABC-2 type transport system ATP-binding protein
MTVLVTTHYMDEAEQCDRLAFILNGVIIADDQPSQLKSTLRGRLMEVRPQGDPFALLSDVQAHDAIEDAYLFGVHLRAVGRADRAQDARSALTRLGATKEAEPSLEDVFVSLARRANTIGAAAQTQVTQ